MPHMALAPGKHSVYNERAQIPFKSKRHLGHGGFGTVDEVEPLGHVPSRQNQAYARKTFTLPFSILAQKKELTIIQNEVKIIKRVEHIHIIKLVETYVCGREFAIILEPVAEGTLKDLLEPYDPEEWPSIQFQLQEQAPQWFGCLVSGLSYLHDHNIRHRDIKPPNILILSGRVLFADFGISLHLPESTLSTYTNSRGTLKYGAPEVATGKRFGRRADVFSLGAVFLEMLTALIGHDILSTYNDTWPGAYADKLDDVSDWITSIEKNGPRDHWYGTLAFLCKTMLQYDPFERPPANEIRQCWKYYPFTALPPTCGCNPTHNDCERWRIAKSTTPKDAANEESRNQESMNLALQLAMSKGHRLAVAILIGQGASADTLTITSEMDHTDTLSGIGRLVSLYGNQRQCGPDEELAKAEEDGYLLKTLDAHSGAVFAVAFSSDGRLIACAFGDHTIRLWDSTMETQTPGAILEGHVDSVLAIAFLPDKLIVSASRDCTMRLWDIATETPHEMFKGDIGSFWAVAFSPDGKVIATASADHTIQLRDSMTGVILKTLSGHSDIIWSMAFSTDGRFIASGSDAYIQIWDSITGEQYGALKGHGGFIYGVEFSPDGKLIASAGNNETIRLWDLKTGTTYKTLEGHSESVLAVAFSPDTEFVASASSDNTVRLWNCTTGALHKILEGHNDRVSATAFSPNGEMIASASHDGTVKLWDFRQLRGTQI